MKPQPHISSRIFGTIATLVIAVLSLTSLHAQDTTNTAAANTGSAFSAKEVEDILAFHNKARKELGIAPLEWSPELASFAQEWADELGRKGCSLDHRPRSGKFQQRYGENCAMNMVANNCGVEASKQWYSEKKLYKRKKQGADWYKSGHYSQMIWRKSAKIGLGFVRCKNGMNIVVANYDPPGNMRGEVAY